MLEVPDFGLVSWSWFGYGHWSLIHPMLNFGILSWFWRCKGHTCPLSPHLALWRTLEVPDWSLASWFWFWFGHWSLIQPWTKFRLSILILKVQRTSMCSKSWFRALKDTYGSWLGFGILILIWIWLLGFETPMFQILTPSLDFEGAKNINVVYVLILGFLGRWTLVTGVWHLYFDLDFFSGLWYTSITNFGPLSLFWRCKENPCPLCPDLGLWRMLELPDWGLASLFWFGYGHWSLIHRWSKILLFILILKVKRTSMSFKASFRALEDGGVSWLGFYILILIWICSLNFVTTIIWILALFLDFKGAKHINVF